MDSTQRSSCSEANPGFTYAWRTPIVERWTLIAPVAGPQPLEEVRIDPARRRCPQRRRFSRLPSAAVPPNPYGEIGETERHRPHGMVEGVLHDHAGAHAPADQVRRFQVELGEHLGEVVAEVPQPAGAVDRRDLVSP